MNLQLSSSVQELDEVQENNEIKGISQSMTPTTQEQIDNIIDHCIEIESNERMRKEHVNRWTLRFNQPDLEEKVCALIIFTIAGVENYNIFRNLL